MMEIDIAEFSYNVSGLSSIDNLGPHVNIGGYIFSPECLDMCSKVQHAMIHNELLIMFGWMIVLSITVILWEKNGERWTSRHGYIMMLLHRLLFISSIFVALNYLKLSVGWL